MHKPRAQTTLRTSVSIEGVGLHSGHPVLAFVRPDRQEARIPALLESASTYDYATTLSSGGISIGTVEHVLSAAAGEGLDNCSIEIDGPEVPILDGSALPFVRLFHAAGFERQDAPAFPLALEHRVEVVRGD